MLLRSDGEGCNRGRPRLRLTLLLELLLSRFLFGWEKLGVEGKVVALDGNRWAAADQATRPPVRDARQELMCL